MKKWKLIVLSAVLSMTVCTQAFAAGVNEPAEDVEQAEVQEQAQEGVRNEDEPEQVPVQGEAEGDATQESEGTEWVNSTLPKLRGSDPDCRFFLEGGLAYKHDEETIELQADLCLRVGGVSSERTFSQEEAKKVFGTDKECKVTVWDLKLYRFVADQVGNREITLMEPVDKPLTELIFGSDGQMKLADNQFGMTPAEVVETCKILVVPADGSGYRECKVSADDTWLYISGLDGIRIPREGQAPNLVLISGEASSSAGTSDSNGSGSSQPGTPEVYSQGAGAGEVGVQKSGVAAQVVKANGEETWTVVHPYVAPGTKSLTQAQAQGLLGTRLACSIYSFDLSIVDAAGDYSQVTLKGGSVPVTFLVPGVTPESRVALRHWINGGSTYEDLPVEVGNGTVTARFTSFSPVVIVVEQPGVGAAAAADGKTSPKTGETPVIYMAEIIALLSLIGFFVSCRGFLPSIGKRGEIFDKRR